MKKKDNKEILKTNEILPSILPVINSVCRLFQVLLFSSNWVIYYELFEWKPFFLDDKCLVIFWLIFCFWNEKKIAIIKWNERWFCSNSFNFNYFNQLWTFSGSWTTRKEVLMKYRPIVSVAHLFLFQWHWVKKKRLEPELQFKHSESVDSDLRKLYHYLSCIILHDFEIFWANEYYIIYICKHYKESRDSQSANDTCIRESRLLTE